MQPLDLQTWGGGLALNYSLAYVTEPEEPQRAKIQLYEVAQGQSNGNPNLDPWRSTNYGASLEYYINPVSMVGLELFRINVESFIENGNVQNCNLPDEDGVVRHRCITIIEPVQGGGNSIQGAEFDYRQGFTLPSGAAALYRHGIQRHVRAEQDGTDGSGRARDSVPGQLDRIGEFHPVVPGQALAGPRGVQLPLEASGGE